MAPQRLSTRSELDDGEFRLADVAQRAAPVIRDVRKARTGRDAFFGQTFFLVVDPAANQADPALVFDHFTHDTHSSSTQRNIRTALPLYWAAGGDPQYYRNSLEGLSLPFRLSF
ncbi:hypothetical protein BN2476_240167 [Paraburkholderia piptadeniae]|uniref:Uncharacterized protein n=1 Tax=Paraburkholderia piptadeniae TaxID=1701573 RepID=A0A1N7RZ94_9BURK|nr:hypothetical protein BN2476_240167 [Paraburkholderia piptadeniae]